MDLELHREARDTDRHPPERALESRDPSPGRDLSRERAVVRERNRVWHISAAERETLFEIGRFRTVAEQDLLKHRYGGKTREMRDDLRSLAAQGLVQRRTARVRSGRHTLNVVVLTPAAKRLLEATDSRANSASSPEPQAVYAGFVKPSEVAHDAAIYRMYHAEVRRILTEGGTIRRIVLDYELKRSAYAPLAKARHLPRPEFAKRQADVAREHGLSVIKGRVVLPDLRIEYHTRDGSRAHVDLELATEHYHGAHLAPKAQAGFKFYVADGSADRLARVLEEREITAAILSL